MTKIDRGTNTRQQETRAAETTQRKASPGVDRWNPATQLDTPIEQAGYRYRWIRETVNGVHDSRNMTMSRREGYEFVRIEEAEGLGLIVDEVDKEDGLARHGGLVLAKIPIEFCQQREAYYAKRRRESVQSANRLQGIEGGNGALPTSFEDRGSGVRNVGSEAAQAMTDTGG